jgi:TonB family protein
MKVTRDIGWLEVGLSAGVHGLVLALVVVLAVATGSASRLPGAAGERGELLGVKGLRVFPVALMAGTPDAAAAAVAEDAPLPATSADVLPPEPPSSGPEPSSDPTRQEIVPTEVREVAESRWTTEPSSGEESADESTARPASEIDGQAGGSSDGQSDGTTITGDAAGTGGTTGAGGLVSGGGADRIQPTPIHVAVPPLPRGMGAQRAHGATVRMLLLVTKTGEVRDVKLVAGSGLDALDESAVEAARRMRFSPGSESGVPAEMWTQAEISF